MKADILRSCRRCRYHEVGLFRMKPKRELMVFGLYWCRVWLRYTEGYEAAHCERFEPELTS